MLFNTYLDDYKNGNCSYMLSYARIRSKLRCFKTLKNDKNGTISVRFLLIGTKNHPTLCSLERDQKPSDFF